MSDTGSELIGWDGGTAKVNETYIGRKKGSQMKPTAGHKHMIFALVQRGGDDRFRHITDKQFAGDG